MKTITLCAGLGSRLRPLTDVVPKCLVEFDGKPILDYQLEVFGACNLNDNSVVSGYLHDKIKQSVKKFHNAKFDTTNMVYSLALAGELFDGSEPVIVSYGDIIFQNSVLEKLIESPAAISVVADLNWEAYWSNRLDDYWSDVESFNVNENDDVISIGQRWETKDEIKGQYIGLIKFAPTTHKNIRKHLDHVLGTPDLHNIFMTDFLQSLINNDEKVSPIYINSGWLEFDQVTDLELKFLPFLNG